MERGGLERFHAWERHQLHPHSSLFCCSVWELQSLQEGKLPLFYPQLAIQARIVTSILTSLQQFFEREPGTVMNPFERLLCGGVAGITSVVFTYPLDIVRTRLSIQTASFAALGEVPKDKLPGMWTTMVLMYKSEGGMAALYRGIIPTVAGVAPYVCFTPFNS